MEQFNSFYRSVNHRKANTWCNYTSRLDPYGCGCEHGCSYCYAKSLLDFRGNWGGVKAANLIEIKRRISSLIPGSIVKLGGMTDCFQPIEKKQRLTYNTIKLLNYYNIHYLIVSKSSLCTEPEYLSIYNKNLAHFQISISNTNGLFENCDSFESRVKSIEILQKLGFDTSIRLSPFLNEYCDVDLINRISCDKILIEFLKVSPFIKRWLNIDYSRYILKYKGYEHLQLDEKISLIKLISKSKQITVGEYVKEHHKYFSSNVNFNKNDCCNLNYHQKTNKFIQTEI